MNAARRISAARARRTRPQLAACRGIFCCCLFLLLCQPARVAAQAKPEGGGGAAAATARARALELFAEGKHLEALPLLEQAAEANPADGAVLQHLAFALITKSYTLPDAAARKAMRFRARAILLRQVELGYNVVVAQSLIGKIAPDGGEDDAFSPRAEVNKAMREGETFFASRQYDKALAAYERALALEPKLYEAALYIGDVYFLQKDWPKMTEWYARAVAIDPERETAHRYWSDALLKQGKMAESHAKAVEAIIGEPYNRSAWVGLIQWAQANEVQLGHPRIESPAEAKREAEKAGANVNAEAPAGQGGASNWAIYEATHEAWVKGRFAKEFPREAAYRHSLREEAEALRGVAEAAARELQSGKVKALDDSLASLVKLNAEGLLEAYILFARADEGIAQDYAEYRKANRDKLRRYLTDHLTVKK
ncbi:MAG TPA: tetratricopeptide repeat protein [Pyrinomonadaceae bacterium]|jgi:tetratricopeptide (TPR) repeat protein